MRLSTGLLAVLFTIGCTGVSDSISSIKGGDGTTTTSGTIIRDDCKTEGGQLGQEGAMLRMGSKSVTFHDWILKTGEGQYIGFSITITGASSMGYIVKTGAGEFHSTALRWEDPAGPDGKDQSPAISHVDFCENCTDGSCGEGTGSGSGSGSGSVLF